jgi:hypothetical protein
MHVVSFENFKLLSSLSHANTFRVFDLGLNEHIFFAIVIFSFRCLDISYSFLLVF